LPPRSDAAHPWQIRHSRRARRLIAKVFPSGRVEIVAPRWATQHCVQQFIARHRAWIERKSGEARARHPVAAAVPQGLPLTIELVALGERWQVRHEAADGDAIVTERAAADGAPGAGVLELRGPPADDSAWYPELRDWLRERVRAPFAQRLQALAREHSFAYSGMVLRRQRTRWGSCSARGSISLNVCLAFQPPEILQYLMIHELAHTRHMNHSPRFWSAVEHCCPRWHELDRELRHGWKRLPHWLFD
jgi:predicted metal-dependent hydrolase